VECDDEEYRFYVSLRQVVVSWTYMVVTKK